MLVLGDAANTHMQQVDPRIKHTRLSFVMCHMSHVPSHMSLLDFRVWCSKLTGPRVLLLGDAAHAVTPVGGQGANAALEDCLFLDGVLDACGVPAFKCLSYYV